MALTETETETEFELVDSLNWSCLPLLEAGSGCVYSWANWNSPDDLIFSDSLFPSVQDKCLYCNTATCPQGFTYY